MNVLMPQLGETVAEGTVAKWHKKAGDKVAVDELLFDVETDKVSMEVTAITAGTITQILVPAGTTVEVGTVLAVIDEGAGAAAARPSSPPASTSTTSRASRARTGRTAASPSRTGVSTPNSPRTPTMASRMRVACVDRKSVV